MATTSILVIDDDQLVHDVITARLERRDALHVLSAGDGPTGLKLAASDNPALILLDWMMPGMNGMEVLVKLKDGAETAQIPVFMLTGKGLMKDVERALEAGAEGYFTKPIRVADLSARIRKYLFEV